MSDRVDPKRLLEWCRIPAEQLVGHPAPARAVPDGRGRAPRWAG